MSTDPRIDAAARAWAIHREHDGCFERVDAWEALEDWEREAHPDEYPESDYEDRDTYLSFATAALAAADAVDPLRKPGHRTEISGDTWTLQHPPECRADMLACLLNEGMRSLDPTCLADGVWAVELDADKELNFTPVVTS